jgi:hypothetical protein
MVLDGFQKLGRCENLKAGKSQFVTRNVADIVRHDDTGSSGDGELYKMVIGLVWKIGAPNVVNPTRRLRERLQAKSAVRFR